MKHSEQKNYYYYDKRWHDLKFNDKIGFHTGVPLFDLDKKINVLKEQWYKGNSDRGKNYRQMFQM